MRLRLHSAVALVMLASCGGGGKPLERARITSPGESLFNGYVKSNVKCYECHDGTGAGTKWGPALAARVPLRTDEELATTIRAGKGKMPGFASKLTDDEVGQLVTWLRATYGRSGS
jgi:mono/diheme cytochrome c family protein